MAKGLLKELVIKSIKDKFNNKYILKNQFKNKFKQGEKRLVH